MFAPAKTNCTAATIPSIISSSLRKWTSDLVGWTLTSTLVGSISRLWTISRHNRAEADTYSRYAHGEALLGR